MKPNALGLQVLLSQLSPVQQYMYHQSTQLKTGSLDEKLAAIKAIGKQNEQHH